MRITEVSDVGKASVFCPGSGIAVIAWSDGSAILNSVISVPFRYSRVLFCYSLSKYGVRDLFKLNFPRAL